MELWFILAALAVFAVSIIIYVLLMMFFPEWVGITGKVALQAEASHKEEIEAEKSDVKGHSSTSENEKTPPQS